MPILGTLLLIIPLHTEASCAAPSLFTSFEDRSDTQITEFVVDGDYHNALFSGGLAHIPSPTNLAMEGNKAWVVYSANHTSAPDSTGTGTITLTPPAIDLMFNTRAAPDIVARVQVIDSGNNVVSEHNVETAGHTAVHVRLSENQLPIEMVKLVVDGGTGQVAIDPLYFRGNSQTPPCNDTLGYGNGAISLLELFMMFFLTLYWLFTSKKGFKEYRNSTCIWILSALFCWT